MAGRDTRSMDPDDWFADPDRAPSRRAQPAAADDWIGPEPRSRLPAQRLAQYLPGRWAPIAGGVLLLLIVLIAWLAFSGGGSKPTPAATTTQVATTPVTPTITPSSVASVPAPATTLKPGDVGAQVKVLQRALASLGYDAGTVDGDYGTATKTALEQFQTSQNLTADGLFGPATRAALIKTLNAG